MANLLIDEEQACLTPNSTVSKVTFFSDRAQVKRRQRVLLKSGENLVVFDNLASSIEGNSIQVFISPGAEDSVLPLSTSLEQNRLYFFKKEEHRALHKKITACLKKIMALLDDKTLYALEKRLIDDLSSYIKLALNDVILEGDTPMGKLDEALDYLVSLADRNSTELIETVSRIKHLEEEYRQLARKLKQVEQLDQTLQSRALVRISCRNECEVTVDIVYTVKQASWVPSYDADLDPAGGSINLTCFGELYQNCGEDWKDARIFLSTVPTDIPLNVPDFYPVYLSGYEEARTNELTVEAEAVGESIETETGGDAGQSDAESQGEEPEAGQPGLKGVTFCIDSEATLLSGTSGYKVKIFGEKLEGSSYYESIPELMESVYLKAVTVNSTGYALLPGMIRVLRGGTYMGQVRMKYVAPGQDFELSFGIDDDLCIRRVLRKNIYTEPGGPLQKQSLIRQIDFSISNHKKKPVKIVVKEAVFVSELKEVTVTLLPETTAGLKPDKEGVVSIELELSSDPFISREAVVSYKVEAPRSFDLSALTAE